jgi:hypothetical protein
MKKPIKTILLIVGVFMLIYGIYTMIAPEASIGIGDIRIDAQDNTNSYITISLGLVALAIGYLGGKK